MPKNNAKWTADDMLIRVPMRIAPGWVPSTAGLATNARELNDLLEKMGVVPPVIRKPPIIAPPVIR